MGFTDIFKIGQFKAEIEQLKQENQTLHKDNTAIHQHLQELGAFDYLKIKELTSSLEQEYVARKEAEEQKLKSFLSELSQNVKDRTLLRDELTDQIMSLRGEETTLERNNKTQRNKLNKTKELIKAVNYALEAYINYEPSQNAIKINPDDLAAIEEISPSVMLKLHCMDVKNLRKAYKENDKQINVVLTKYSSRYTTKANQAIYKLMVIALRAELQNILYNLRYEKLDKSIDEVKEVTQKYLQIAGSGNQSIVGTLTKFIGEIEYLFINSVKIEYNYYVKREQAKAEQAAIREQIRQEAAERKALEAERKKVEQEESKYNAEITKLQEQLSSVKDAELDRLNARILELQSQLSAVVIKKEEISNLANGKAGNVYVISNLGSFGDNVFKIGMTRRLNPQDRVNELGDASVPFKFDVHSFIFSDDAVGLESKLHNILNEKRVNKVNLRKEFFYTTIEELEELVTAIEPTAEFNKTMLAEEFRQSQSSNGLYTSDFSYSEDEDE